MSEMIILGLTFKDLRAVSISVPGVAITHLGCIAPTPNKTWRLFVPPMILHTILYLFTAYRRLNVRSATAPPLVERLMRECVCIFDSLAKLC